jgi:preprotein translocase subunit SecA
VLDRKWREHLYEMDYLQEGIGLRAMAQRDPLVEYQKEGFDMFRAMMDAIQEESVGFLFNLEVQIEGDQSPVAEEGSAADLEPAELNAEAVLAALATQPDPDDHPHISAKGLGRPRAETAPLTYSAPALGSDTPEVHVEGGATPAGGSRAGAAKQRRANPNRGSRGNKRKR